MTDDEDSACTEPKRLTAVPGPWPSRLLLNGAELFVENRSIVIKVDGKEHRIGVDHGTIVGDVYSWEQGHRVRVQDAADVKRWRAGR